MSDRIEVKDHVKAGECEFVSARAGNLWYRTALGFEFPVPFSDMGDASFAAREKGILLMRYIRRHADVVEAARQTQPAN